MIGTTTEPVLFVSFAVFLHGTGHSPRDSVSSCFSSSEELPKHKTNTLHLQCTTTEQIFLIAPFPQSMRSKTQTNCDLLHAVASTPDWFFALHSSIFDWLLCFGLIYDSQMKMITIKQFSWDIWARFAHYLCK